MRLLTQNMLVCQVKSCVATAGAVTGTPKSFPLRVEPAAGGIVKDDSEYSRQVIEGLLPKLDWAALRQTATEMGIAKGLPEAITDEMKASDGFLRSVHSLLLDVHVMEGRMVCPHCSRVYPITKGVPNMLLREEEL